MFNIFARDANRVSRDSCARRRSRDLARLDVELCSVPGAFNLVTFERPLAQWTPAMGTGVIDGVKLTGKLE